MTAPAAEATTPAAAVAGRELRVPAAGDWTLRVRAPAAELAWLDEFLCPPFHSTPIALESEIDVDVVVDPARHAESVAGDWSAAVPVAVFALDAGAVEMPLLAADDGERLARDDDFGVVYRLAPGTSQTVEIVTPTAEIKRRTPLLRVVRERLMGRLFADGRPLLHAAAVERDGRSLGFLGATGAGKTSLLLHALGLPGARLLANDRLAVLADGRSVTAFAVPTILTLRESGLAFFPELAARLAASRYSHRRTLAEAAAPDAPPPRPWSNGKYGLTPAQLAALLGVERAACAELAALLLPRHTGERGGLVVRRLSATEALAELRSTQLAHGAWMLPTALFRPPGVSETDAFAVRDAALERLAKVPLFAADLGLDAYADPATHERLAGLLEAGA